LQQLEEEYFKAQQDPVFQQELNYYLRQFCGRPSPLYFAERLTRELGGPIIYLKREDLLHTGAHKINNAMGQILVARRMGKTRIIAETGAGQHGVATVTDNSSISAGESSGREPLKQGSKTGRNRPISG